MDDGNLFLFATCQVGAEAALKGEVARLWPGARPAFARPGFLTFKCRHDVRGTLRAEQPPVFARVLGCSMGWLAGETPLERRRAFDRHCQALRPAARHVFPRDTRRAGWRGYEPGPNESSAAAQAVLCVADPAAGGAGSRSPARPARHGGPPRRGALVADVVVVDPDAWWLGYHEVHAVQTTWPGGFFPLVMPPHAVSRAYLKMNEAICWSGFKIRAGQSCVEIGSAPGGATQALLEAGLSVVGIDPAAMHETVALHPRFRHIRRRAKEVRRREFLGVDWLTCDLNLPPNYALDALEAVVAYPGVRLRGLLVTLKLITWDLAAQIPAYLDRVRGWGFRDVRARQLHHNRQEICLAAR